MWDAISSRKFKSVFANFHLVACSQQEGNDFLKYLRQTIASPHFQLEVLRWLDKEGLERVMKKYKAIEAERWCICNYCKWEGDQKELIEKGADFSYRTLNCPECGHDTIRLKEKGEGE